MTELFNLALISGFQPVGNIGDGLADEGRAHGVTVNPVVVESGPCVEQRRRV